MTNSLDVALLFGLFPKEEEKEIHANTKGFVQNAANILQWGFVKGFDKLCKEHSLRIINSVYNDSFPKGNKKLFTKTYSFHHTPSSNDINVGYCNLAGYSSLSRYYRLRKHLKSWATDGSSNNKVIIAYALTSAFTKSLKYIKRLNSNIITCAIVPDLPDYMYATSNSSLLSSMYIEYETNTVYRHLEFIDLYVLLTEQMAEKLSAKRFVVVEGIASTDLLFRTRAFINKCSINNCTNKKIVVYAGTLMRKYGIVNLLEAFRLIDKPNYELKIFGSGDSQGEIIKASMSDKRIVYCGQKSREDIIAQITNATVVVNPRQNNDAYTAFSFPSKNIETLSLGIPLIAYRLDGIPTEYDDYIYYVHGNSIDDLRNRIIDVCEKSRSELTAFGLTAQHFAINEKSPEKQVAKIVNMIESYTQEFDNNP